MDTVDSSMFANHRKRAPANVPVPCVNTNSMAIRHNEIQRHADSSNKKHSDKTQPILRQHLASPELQQEVPSTGLQDWYTLGRRHRPAYTLRLCTSALM